MSKIILSADLGKYDVKVVGRDLEKDKEIKEVCFRTKMYDLKNGFIELQGNSYEIDFDGKQYIVGEQGTDNSNDTSKTNLLHKLCCYAAITNFIEPGTKGNEIYMVLACPLSVLQIQSAKDEYKNFIKGDGEVNITVNNKKYSFTIKEIMIKAEGSGILYLEKAMFTDKDVAVVDLGGLNMSFSLFRNGVCNNKERFIEELGGNYLVQKIREHLIRYKNGNLVSLDQAEMSLKKGYLPQGGEIDAASISSITNAKEEYFKDILKNIKQNGYEIDNLDKIIFVGGTTQNIKNQISKHIKHSFVPQNSNMTTVNGLYKIAFAKWGQNN